LAPIEPPAPPPGLAQTVMYQPAAAAPAGGAAAEPPPALPMRAYLRMQEQLFAIKEPVAVLGRSKRCDIVLPDPNVSRQHAEIRLEGDGHVLVDLDSTNGVKINGREVKRAVLADGDRIELGSTELRFERRP
jgi:pSer/pThr/pTyr-binding forkhead associated (FHA) protein